MAKTKDEIETDPFECGELTEEEWRAVELAAEKQVASEALRERCAALRQCLEDIIVQSEALLEGAPDASARQARAELSPGVDGSPLALDNSPMTICEAATLMQPDKGRLISGYGVRRGRTTGAPTMHAGIDIGGLERKTPIYAPVAGIVEYVGHDSARSGGFRGYGNCVVVRHDDDGEPVWSFYAHMDKNVVEPGQRVYAGQQVGTMGATTNGKFPGMGAHLHFEVRTQAANGGSPFPGPYAEYNIDPRPWLEERGLLFSREGLGYEPFLGACGSPVGPVVDLAGLRGARRSLRGLGAPDAGVDGGEDDIDWNRDYEPPIPDIDFKGTPLWLHAGAAVLTAGIGAAALVIAKK